MGADFYVRCRARPSATLPGGSSGRPAGASISDTERPRGCRRKRALRSLSLGLSTKRCATSKGLRNYPYDAVESSPLGEGLGQRVAVSVFGPIDHLPWTGWRMRSFSATKESSSGCLDRLRLDGPYDGSWRREPLGSRYWPLGPPRQRNRMVNFCTVFADLAVDLIKAKAASHNLAPEFLVG